MQNSSQEWVKAFTGEEEVARGQTMKGGGDREAKCKQRKEGKREGGGGIISGVLHCHKVQ